MVYFTGTPQFQYQKENRESANHSCCSSKSCAVIGCLAVFFLVLKLGGTSEINHPVSYLKILRTKLIGKMWNEVCIDLVSHAFAELLTADWQQQQPASAPWHQICSWVQTGYICRMVGWVHKYTTKFATRHWHFSSAPDFQQLNSSNWTQPSPSEVDILQAFGEC